MRTSDRRRALQLAMAAAIAPAIASRSVLARSSDFSRIVPPHEEMLFSRRLTHQLSANASISVSRTFSVRFNHTAAGFEIVGRQVSVEVDAPPSLARFSDIERGRDETSLFPIPLDNTGHICVSGLAAPPGGDVQIAVEQALREIPAHPLDSDEREQVSRMIVTMQQIGQRVAAFLPADLFVPATAARIEERRVALPGGTEGRIAMTFVGARDHETGLMREATREIVTSVEGESKHNREQWGLSRG